MRPIIKLATSPIAVNSWKYPNNRTQIMPCLEQEQDYYCAYTEYRFDPGCARDIEHFNPNLKGTASDDYYNWYAVSHRWNNIKGTKWFAPCYTPSDPIISSVYRYSNGYYLYDKANLQADNLARLIGLNELNLVEERNDFIDSLNYLVNNKVDLKVYFQKFPKRILFRTAIETVFGFLP